MLLWVVGRGWMPDQHAIRSIYKGALAYGHWLVLRIRSLAALRINHYPPPTLLFRNPVSSSTEVKDLPENIRLTLG
jgi:hypothetical protein